MERGAASVSSWRRWLGLGARRAGASNPTLTRRSLQGVAGYAITGWRDRSICTAVTAVNTTAQPSTCSAVSALVDPEPRRDHGHDRLDRAAEETERRADAPDADQVERVRQRRAERASTRAAPARRAARSTTGCRRAAWSRSGSPVGNSQIGANVSAQKIAAAGAATPSTICGGCCGRAARRAGRSRRTSPPAPGEHAGPPPAHRPVSRHRRPTASARPASARPISSQTIRGWCSCRTKRHQIALSSAAV